MRPFAFSRHHWLHPDARRLRLTCSRGHRPLSYGIRLLEIHAILAATGAAQPLTASRQKACADLGWATIQQALAERCSGDAAAEIAVDLGALPDSGAMEARRADVVALAEILRVDEPPPVRGYRDVREVTRRAQQGDVLAAPELIAIRETLEVAARVREWFRPRASRVPLSAAHAEQITVLNDLVREIRRTFDPFGEVADSASPELGRLRRRAQQLRQGILERLDRILRSPRFEGILREEYVTIREERYVVPVRAGEKGDFPGIVHGQSGSGQTLFIEPQELIGANNELRLAQMEVENEVRRILAALTRLVERSADAILHNLQALTVIDLATAAARLTVDLNMAAPRLEPCRPGARLALFRARHPILALRSLTEGFQVIPNDIELPAGTHVLVVSGPNTGGKTVTLKTLGLFTLMTRAGLPVPASPDSVMPLWERVFSDIGDEQTVERDLSTFSGHVRNLVRMLPDCDGRSLVLLDELFAGTDPDQGAALGRALLDELANRGSWVVVTTHLERLKTLSFEDKRYAAASVGFDVDRLEPTYVLRAGIPGSSYAFRIAQRLGMPARIVDRAAELSEQGGGGRAEALVEQLERETVRVARLQRDVEVERRQVDEERTRLARRLEELARRDREALDAEVRALRRSVAEASAELAQVRRAVRPAPAPGDDAALQAAVEAARTAVRKAEEASPAAGRRDAPEGRKPSVGELAMGTEVLVVPFGKRGEVAEPPRTGDRIVVRVGPMRASFSLDELRLLPSASDRPGIPAAATGRAQAFALGEATAADDTLDLRGTTVDDALEQLGAFLDRAVRREAWLVRIIHGHGTGALKRAVRQAIPTLGYGARFRPGERDEGGDGITIVQFGSPPAATGEP